MKEDYWQTMDSAPKDGEHILIYRKGHVIEGWWKMDHFDGLMVWGGIGWNFPNDDEPMWWQPITKPKGAVR